MYSTDQFIIQYSILLEICKGQLAPAAAIFSHKRKRVKNRGFRPCPPPGQGLEPSTYFKDCVPDLQAKGWRPWSEIPKTISFVCAKRNGSQIAITS